jgi:uncharacterized protein YdbL (DUF1318 family)
MAKTMLAAVALSGALMLAATPVSAQGEPVLAEEKSQRLVGEQADGFLGFPPGVNVTADLRARVDQVNIRRRAVYTQRATRENTTVANMAAAVACQIFANRISVGERYLAEVGQWRQRTASQPVVMPSFCSAD